MPSDAGHRLTVARVPPERAVPSLEDDVRAGLLAPPRSLPPKYFYDATGAELFEQITRTDDYYPTRCEAQLLAQHGADAMALAAPVHLIELGSGSSRKTRALLGDPGPALTHYWPFDVSETMLVESAEGLCRDFPALRVHALVGDYTAGLGGVAAQLPDVGRRLVAFLGGTLGNFDPALARRCMQDVLGLLRPGDHVLLGIDRHKDAEVLTRAYNDAEGITARFNRNVLQVLNDRLDANFELSAFDHLARYDETRQQIAMYLLSRDRQAVTLGAMGETLQLDAGEAICTEISRKFDEAGIAALLQDAGLEAVHVWTTPAPETYSLVLARRP